MLKCLHKTKTDNNAEKPSLTVKHMKLFRPIGYSLTYLWVAMWLLSDLIQLAACFIFQQKFLYKL